MIDAVFLDRDGVLNEELGYASDPSGLELIPGAADAIRALNEHSIPVIVVTNQAGVARGYYPESQVSVFHDALNRELLEHGAHIDAFYYCPHHPTAGQGKYAVDCDCRKPKPGLLLRAAKDFNLDLKRCAVIGDKASDIGAGVSVGSTTVLVMTGHGEKHRAAWNQPFQPHHIAAGLQDAVTQLLRSASRNSSAPRTSFERIERIIFGSGAWKVLKAHMPTRMRTMLRDGWLKIKRLQESAEWTLLSPRYVKNWPSALFYELVLPKGRYLKYLLKHTRKSGSYNTHDIRLTIRAKSYDKFIVQEISTGAYDIALKDLPARPTVIDAGAHIGVFAVRVLIDFPSAHLFCIEPVSENLMLLEKNLRDNHLFARATVIRGVLASKSGTMKIYGRKDHSAGFNVYMPTEMSESVRSHTLEEILKSNRIKHCDLLKLDIEGSEYEVLFGAPEHVLSHVQRIVMEYHPFPKDVADVHALARFLNAQGFTTAFYAKKLLYAERAS